MDEPFYAWRYDAKCLGQFRSQNPDMGLLVAASPAKDLVDENDIDIFYPPRDKSLYKPVADESKDMCFGRDGMPECPVRRQCLWEAIKSDEPHGIWGGMSHRERNALVRKWKSKYYRQTLKDFVLEGPK